MYQSEDEFVRGQKIKLVLIVVLLAIAFLSGCGEPAWKEELAQQCRVWKALARTHSDSLNVTMQCASIYASREARDAANDAAVMSSAALGMASASSGAAAASRAVPR
jgi:hypothetical protein